MESSAVAVLLTVTIVTGCCYRPAGMTSAISSFSAAAALGGGNDYSPSVGGLSEQEKRRIIEEENAQLQQLKVELLTFSVNCL